MSARLFISADNGEITLRASGARFIMSPDTARGLADDLTKAISVAEAQISMSAQTKMMAARKALDKAKAEVEALEGGA